MKVETPEMVFAHVRLVGQSRRESHSRRRSRGVGLRQGRTNSGNFTEWVTQLKRTVSRGASNEEKTNEWTEERQPPLNEESCRLQE